MLRNVPIEDVLAEARDAYSVARPKSLQTHRQASEHMPGGNTRTVLYHGPFPIRASGGEGALLHDVDGFRYINLLGEYTAGVFGHSHPAIRQAVEQAMDVGVNLGAHNTAEAHFAELVGERFPAMQKVRFTNSGTEANMMAVSAARGVTSRDKVMVFKGGYHGALLYFGDDFNPINAPFDYLIGEYNDQDGARRLLREYGSEISCVLVEPMQGSSGCIPGEAEFFHVLREETERAGSLLIFDEVMTSRFGRHGAHDLLGIKPDLMTLGKWVGGGMSFGAFGGRADIMDRFDPARPGAFRHAGTFNNNTLTMHAGIAALSEAFTADAAEALHSKGEVLREQINAICASRQVAIQASGVGSLLNLHPVASPVRSVRDLSDASEAVKELLFLDLLAKGYYIAPRGFIALSTVLDGSHLEGFVAAFEQVLEERQSVLPACRTAAA